MIYTSNYNNCLTGNKVSISGDRGRNAGYQGLCFPPLAPKLSFWNEWHNNIGKIAEEENNYFYIKNYYNLVLKQLDSKEIVKLFNKDTIFLCYENNDEFCHRHIVAYWLEKELGIKVPEIKTDELGNITILERPKWIKDMFDKVIEEEKKKDQGFLKKLIKKIEGV